MSIERPTLDERLALASTSARLMATPDVDGLGGSIGGLELLGAAGMAGGRYASSAKYLLGRLVLAMEAGWRGVGRPPPGLTVDMAASWTARSRAEKVSSLRALKPAHALLAQWAAEQGIKKPERRALTVIAWWLDRHCPACGGTGLKSQQGRAVEQPCEECHGAGERERPCGRDGLMLAQRMGECREYALRKVSGCASRFPHHK